MFNNYSILSLFALLNFASAASVVHSILKGYALDGKDAIQTAPSYDIFECARYCRVVYIDDCIAIEQLERNTPCRIYKYGKVSNFKYTPNAQMDQRQFAVRVFVNDYQNYDSAAVLNGDFYMQDKRKYAVRPTAGGFNIRTY